MDTDTGNNYIDGY